MFMEHWEQGEYGEHRKHGKHQPDNLKYSICDGSRHSICDRNTLFYVWKTWAWVSSRLENVKWLGEACAIFWQVSNHPSRILDIFNRQYTIFLDFLFVFFKRPAQILPQDRKINGFKGCTVFARVTQKGWWQTDRWRKVTVFLGLRRRGHRRPRHTECVLYAPLVAWWWPGCTRAR